MEDSESLRDYHARLQDDKRPLIERINNQWKNEKTESVADYEEEVGFCDLENDGSCPNATYALCTSRRFRKMIAYALVFVVAAYYIWSKHLQPQLEDDWAYREGFVSQENGTYGIAKGGDLDPDLIRLKHLHHDLLPGGKADKHGKRRLVFIGDVHGCKEELLKLLIEVDFNSNTDQLILTGDIVSKGPDNPGVIDELVRLNAISVRGNHEDRILQIAKSLDTTLPTPTAETSSKGMSKDVALIKTLKPHHLKYLRALPLMLHIPVLPQASRATKKYNSPITQHILVVHAGLVPGVRLDKQDPYYVMNMRSIHRRTHVPSVMRDGKNAKPWFDVWGWYNERIAKKSSALAVPYDHTDSWVRAIWKNAFGERRVLSKPQVVVYGHDSKAGLQMKRWSKGLDSGCVGGGELTAMVLDARGEYRLFSVGCENYRGK